MLNFNTGILSAANNLAINQPPQMPMGAGEPTGLSDQEKADWNKFLLWLKNKGVQGKPELDKNFIGNKYFSQYLKENPKTTLSVDIIPKVRDSYKQLRNKGIEDLISGKSVLEGSKGNITQDTTKFMSNIVENEKSKDPNYVGQHLTMTFFPGGIIKEKETGKVLKSVPLLDSKNKRIN